MTASFAEKAPFMKPVPRVTIGVPIFNGGELLRSCLENLRRQTFINFKVVIFDNRSTDNTPAICKEYVDLDARFSYHLNEENIGAWPNLVALAKACDSEYFIWRAYDDHSDENYLEEMVKLLDSHPDAELAVGRVETLREHRSRKKIVTPALEGLPTGRTASIRLMKRAHASWLYSLWRTRTLQDRLDKVIPCYPFAWGGDFVVLFETLYRTRVAGSNRSTFYQRIIERDYKAAPEQLTVKLENVVTYRNAARDFLQSKSGFHAAGWVSKALLAYLISWFVEHRIYPARKVRKLKRQVCP